MQLYEVRNLLLKSGSLTTGGTNGIIYMDGKGASSSFDDYNRLGPNNEVYLSAGQAIAFKLHLPGGNLSSLDLGLKSAGEGSPVAQIQLTKADNMQIFHDVASIPVSSATSLFYDLTEGIRLSDYLSDSQAFYVVVHNTGSGILSITDLKIAGNTGAAVLSDTGTVEAAALALEPCYDVRSARFAGEAVAIMQIASLTVVTGRDVQALQVVDEAGNMVGQVAEFLDTSDGNRTWRVLVRPTQMGVQTYTVTGAGSDGTTGQSLQAQIHVVLF